MTSNGFTLADPNDRNLFANSERFNEAK